MLLKRHIHQTNKKKRRLRESMSHLEAALWRAVMEPLTALTGVRGIFGQYWSGDVRASDVRLPPKPGEKVGSVSGGSEVEGTRTRRTGRKGPR